MPERCVATVSVYSGRPDPEWPLDAKQIAELRRAWRTLALYSARVPAAPGLGYRGVVVRCPSGEAWHVFGGVVTHHDGRGAADHRRDDARRLEKMLLATAPRGVMPSGLPGMDDLREP